MINLLKSPHKSHFILAINVLICMILLNVLPFSTMENRGLVLLVFAGILWLTEAYHITVTALMIPVLAVFGGLLTTKQAFSTFSEPIIFMFFGGFVLAAILQVQNLDKMLASYIIRWSGGSLKRAVYYLFAVTALLSMWINNTAVAAMMLPLTIGLLSTIDVKKYQTTYAYTLLGVAFCASIGGIGTLVGSTPNAILATQLDISFAQWFKYGTPVMILLLPSLLFSLQVVLKPNLNQQIDLSNQAVEKLNNTQKITLVMFAVTVVVLCFGSLINPVLSSFLGLKEKIANFDSIMIMAIICILMALKTATWQQVQERTEWGVLMLFGGGLALSLVLKDSGASKIVADTLVAFVGQAHWLIIMLSLAAFIVFWTEFTSNTASAALLTPIFIAVAQSLGVPEISLAAIIACGASCAFMLPIATPPNAIVFATGHIKQQQMVKVGLILNICAIAIIGGLAYTVWRHQ
ncbi:SLC13 family permease [Moraxella nasicaprae]|uniref:DASS family sodium-coupled anion symporter n=1 Tax=Moraxella nasicaprae TaxID=2904122 RepID=A0ABY6F4C0_9GAMM|nr:DASS family sodium-coupled anion symporter [Moraxella nasicaprae]UXZ04898.1 DASS family sodium-coupled anion symporter [Moraxella nasicaprae]